MPLPMPDQPINHDDALDGFYNFIQDELISKIIDQATTHKVYAHLSNLLDKTTYVLTGNTSDNYIHGRYAVVPTNLQTIVFISKNMMPSVANLPLIYFKQGTTPDQIHDIRDLLVYEVGGKNMSQLAYLLTEIASMLLVIKSQANLLNEFNSVKATTQIPYSINALRSDKYDNSVVTDQMPNIIDYYIQNNQHKDIYDSSLILKKTEDLIFKLYVLRLFYNMTDHY